MALGAVLALVLVGGAFTAYKIYETSSIAGPDVISGAECYQHVDETMSNWHSGMGSNLGENLDVHGAFYDTDGVTKVFGYTPEQRQQIQKSYEQLANQFVDHRAGDSMWGVSYVIYNNSDKGSPEEQSDGQLNAGYEICMTFGSKDWNWGYIQRKQPDYKMGDVPASER
ncbi:hypothetical protein GTC6_05242 [Gordonia terrae C-6]|uniref:Uncharacterized protein n=1 Tax=Gordonia terrae C-6 TaxID=1316928 RepID=R7YCJ0_9ACTN|nr:hypothetical protein [Gordonia terrae]EON33745.1 hypothetical protein GTC6_05242 [Gordonia terrae C-6]